MLYSTPSSLRYYDVYYHLYGTKGALNAVQHASETYMRRVSHYYSVNAILPAQHTSEWYYVVLAATPKQASSGLILRCSTSIIDNDRMALMLCPSALSAPTLMGYLHAYNAISWASHTKRRVDVVLAATPN